MSIFGDQQAEQKAKEDEFRRAEDQCQLHIDALARYLDQNKRELHEKGITFRVVSHPSRPQFGMYESAGKIIYSMYPQSDDLVIIALPTGLAFAVVSSASHGDCRYQAPWLNSESRPEFAADGERYESTSLPYEARTPEDVMKVILLK